MGLYGFQKRFVPMILAGTKNHTIRATRAYPDEPGRTLHLYTGLRTSEAKLIKRVVCTKVLPIRIVDAGVFIDGRRLAGDECESLARDDGFENFADMMAFWNGRRPFNGHIIHWGKQ
jgi:hypothetical protein